MKGYTPRKRKVQSIKVRGAQKLVRIDDRTEIMIDVDIPDDVARDRYLTRLGRNVLYGFKPIGDIKVPEVMPLGSLEQLQEIVDPLVELPEEE